MQDPWLDRLSEYLDGDLAPSERDEAERHLGECLVCREALAGLRAVAQAAGALENRAPERDLWPGILDRIREEAPTRQAAPGVLQLDGRKARPARRFSFSAPQLLAASIALIAVSGTAARLALGPGPGTAADVPVRSDAVARDAFGAEAAVLITAVEESWGQAIDDLEQEFAARRDQLDPETVRVVEENLGVIDGAIAEARAALARDPANGYLYRHFDNTMTRKVELLRRAAAGAALAST